MYRKGTHHSEDFNMDTSIAMAIVSSLISAMSVGPTGEAILYMLGGSLLTMQTNAADLHNGAAANCIIRAYYS